MSIVRLKPLSPDILLTLYKAYITPIYDYCCIVWNSCSNSLSEKLDKVHSKAMCLINQNAHSNGLTTPSLRRKYFIAVQTYKILNNLSPSYLDGIVTLANVVTNRDLRNRYRIYVPMIHSNYGRAAFYYVCTKIWNSIPQSICASSSLMTFKLNYKSKFIFN